MAVRDLPEIERGHPGWEGWVSLVGGQHHARLINAYPPVMVHGPDVESLSVQIRQCEARGLDNGTNRTMGEPA